MCQVSPTFDECYPRKPGQITARLKLGSAYRLEIGISEPSWVRLRVRMDPLIRLVRVDT